MDTIVRDLLMLSEPCMEQTIEKSPTMKPGPGRDETYWTSMLDELPTLAEPLTVGDMLFLAPHPDDEVLACGGLLQRWSRLGGRIELWMVTDGEACFGAAADSVKVGLRRRHEASEAHQRLGIDAKVNWLSLPDGEVSNHQDRLRDMLGSHLRPDTILMAPPPLDGHPDHDCTGAIAYELARQRKLLLMQYPIWMWHWGTGSELQAGNVVRLELSAAEEVHKREAIAAFSSQIRPEHGAAVLPRSVLRHFRRPFEVLFVEDFRVDANAPAVF